MLHFLGFVGFGVWPLAFVATVPLWMALERERCAGWRRAALPGFVFGWVSYAGGYHWMSRVVEVFLDGDLLLGAPLWLAHSCWFALRFALTAVLYQRLRRRGAPVLLAAVSSWLALEWLAPALFPYHLGSALVGSATWIQVVDLGGPLLASALVLLVSVALFETWRFARNGGPRPLGTWILSGVAVAGTLAYGAARSASVLRAAREAPALRVGVVQANLDVEAKRRDPDHVHERYLAQTRTLLAGGAVDLVVWPETVYTRGLRRPLPISGELIRAELRAPILFGGASVRTDTGRRLRYNSALLIGADGVIRSAYDKNLLIPLAESLPFAGLWPGLAARLPNAQRFSAATDTPALELDGLRIATPICYEAVRPAFVRRMVRASRPQLLVTLANDAWFGDSQEPAIHLALARLRAVEHRRYLVRATNSGISAVVDPSGRVIAQSGLLTSENLRATVHALDGGTVYTALGDWPGWLAVAATLVGLVRSRGGHSSSKGLLRSSAPAGPSPSKAQASTTLPPR